MIIRASRRRFKRMGLFFMAVLLYLIYRCYTADEMELDSYGQILLLEASISSASNNEICRIPNLPIDDPEMMKFYKKVDKIDCGSLDDWVTCENSICFVKPEINTTLEGVICSYTDVIRVNDFKNIYGNTTVTREVYTLKESDFVKVACHSRKNEASWSGLVHGIRAGVRHHKAPKVYEVIDYADNQVIYLHNVLILGFDSLSRNAFIRKMPKTYAYLVNELEATVLKGYNIVGDGKAQALIPLLTGYTELELPDIRKSSKKSKNVDVYPMLWKEFSRHGYVTSFNEDLPHMGTFTFRLNGFNKQPVNHYLRTLYVESNKLDNTAHCMGHNPDHLVFLNYTRNFMAKYQDVPRFVFSFHGGLSHGSMNTVGAADDDVVSWLEYLNYNNLLDNTIVVVMSNHGSRFSQVRSTFHGKLEELLPFFSFAFPQNFRLRFPHEYANFQSNAERLTTPFDVHATFKHLLDLQLTDVKVPPPHKHYMGFLQHLLSNIIPPKLTTMAANRAISLFNEIPLNRTCGDAYIEPHLCSCMRWHNFDLKNTDNIAMVLQLAASIVNAINNATDKFRERCAALEVISVSMRFLPNKWLEFRGFWNDSNSDIYHLQIVTLPGEAMFEASVKYDTKTMKAQSTRLSEISRLNLYESQAKCIYESNPELRKFCYCKKKK